MAQKKLADTTTQTKVLQTYPKAVAHLRRQYESKRLGIVLGAGLSLSFGLPDWETLVGRIAEDPAVDGKEILARVGGSALPYQTEMLFQHFRARERKRTGQTTFSREFEFDTTAKWRDIVRKQLYGEAGASLTTGDIESHPYLQALLPIVREVRVTVTYNFDDLLEGALHLTRSTDEVEASRGYVAVTNGALQLGGRGPVIYHPNGLVPSSVMEMPSDRLIFSEHSYADHLVDLFSGDHSRLVAYLTDNTCLFVGVSLKDQSLRNVLRQCARSNPGNYHYLVSHVSKEETASQKEREATIQTNFRVYNLITLYLSDQEISGLASLIQIGSDSFCDLAESHGIATKYCYYLTGALGVGKSTAIASLNSLSTFDEWLEPRLPILAKPWQELDESERKTADDWIARQFKLKNDNLRKSKYGVFVLDRGPLDPLAFTPVERWAEKASNLRNSICPEKSNWQVHIGCVVLLRNDSNELSLRMRLTERERYSPERLEDMREQLMKAYGAENVILVDTAGLSPAGVANRIAEIIHLQNYKPMDLHKRLSEIAKGRDHEEH